MRILLVRPPQPPDTIGLRHIMIVEPLELEVIAATVAPPHDVTIVDMLLERKPFEEIVRAHAPDVVGFTGYITTVGVIRDLAVAVKRIDSRMLTVVGGVHAEVSPHDFDSEGIDFRVVRNATRAFPRLLDHMAGLGPRPAGVLARQQMPDANGLPPFDFYYPHPRRDLTQHYRHRYFYFYQDRVALLKTSFGCPYSCRFCVCRIVTGGHYHVREIGDVLDELEGIEQREIYIVDDDFLIAPQRVEEFIEGLHARHIRKHFQVYTRADFVATHPDLITAFRGAGLRVVIVGLESFDDAELAGYRKDATAMVNERAMEILNRLRIDVYATFILSPDWRHEEFRRLAATMRRLGIRFANLQPLTPLPGVDYQVPAESLVVPRTRWEAWDLAHVTVRPTHLPVSEFYRELLRLYDGILRRPTNMVRTLTYPPHMQARILRGLTRVRQQYRGMIRATRHA